VACFTSVEGDLFFAKTVEGDLEGVSSTKRVWWRLETGVREEAGEKLRLVAAASPPADEKGRRA
jgi:hypothetical protein